MKLPKFGLQNTTALSVVGRTHHSLLMMILLLGTLVSSLVSAQATAPVLPPAKTKAETIMVYNREITT